jgi:hypothetical protein
MVLIYERIDGSAGSSVSLRQAFFTDFRRDTGKRKHCIHLSFTHIGQGVPAWFLRDVCIWFVREKRICEPYATGVIVRHNQVVP